MGHDIIIEISPHDKGTAKEHFLLRKNAQALANIPQVNGSSTLYRLRGEKNHFLKRKTWLAPYLKHKTHKIICSYRKKVLDKVPKRSLKKHFISKWIQGMNLLTFKMCCGSFPSKDQLKSALATIQNPTHHDWIINNMILQGNKLTLIDFNDPRNMVPNPDKVRRCTPLTFTHHCSLIDIDEPEKVRDFFFNKILPEKGVIP